VALIGTNGRALAVPKPSGASGPMSVAWAFIVGVTPDGGTVILDHDLAHLVEAKRAATLDDMYGALNEILMAAIKDLDNVAPREHIEDSVPFVCSFLVFSVDGNIGLSPNVFEDISVMGHLYPLQIRQAVVAAQAQIMAKHAARLAGLVATNQALATVGRVSADAEAARQASAVAQTVDRSRND
jgi:hypothetical protein